MMPDKQKEELNDRGPMLCSGSPRWGDLLLVSAVDLDVSFLMVFSVLTRSIKSKAEQLEPGLITSVGLFCKDVAYTP